MSVVAKGWLIGALIMGLSGAVYAQGAGGGAGAGGGSAGKGGTGMGTPNAGGTTASPSGASGANSMGATPDTTQKRMKHKKGSMASPASDVK